MTICCFFFISWALVLSVHADDRPNIIMIMADDLGAETIGAYGTQDYQTPVLDGMASSGVKFERAYSTPLCTPTRVQLMTGRYTHRNYIGFGQFPVGERTFGHQLQDAGYTTCMVGKWQLGGDHETPHQIGFDEYCLQNSIMPEKPFDRKTRGWERFWGYPVIVANGELYESKNSYGPDMLNEYACDFIRRNKEEPFFLYYPMILPHSPFVPTPLSTDGDKSGKKISELKYFGDMIEYTDHLVGRVLSTLEDEGIRDNTLVLFTGDNGTTYPVKVTKPAPEGFPKVDGIHGVRHIEHLEEGKARKPKDDFEGPLTRTDRGMIPGGKDLMSERGVHVPLIVDWPRYRKNFQQIGHTNTGLVDFTDFFTTFVELGGGELPSDRIQDGKSLASALKGESDVTDRDVVFCHYWEFGRKQEAAKTSIHEARWKLYDDGTCYDLANDLDEKKPLSRDDLSSADRDTIDQLQNRMDTILASDDASMAAGTAATSETKPNVVLIFADDLGWGDVGYHGFDDVLTPNIDRIAKGGVQFSQGYVSASVCGPSRAGLVTGVYQQRLGAGENANATGYPDKVQPQFRMSGLPTSQPTLAEILRPHGYRCGMVGKWHLGVDEPLRPNARGFHFFWGFLNGSHTYTEWQPVFAERKDKWPVFRNNKMLPATKDIYLTDEFSDRAVSFINHKPDSPFFLFLSYNAVHHPWQVPDKYLERTKHLAGGEDRRFFAAMILAMDDGIGRVLDSLDQAGVADDTIVIFLSDNGSPRGQGLKPKPKDNAQPRGDTVMSNPGPHRGFKGDTYEGGIKVPFTMRWPAQIAAGSTYSLPVSALDIVPTVAATVGVDAPEKGLPFDGVDLLPFLQGRRGQDRPHETLYWRRDNDYAIREGDWKLTWNDASGDMSIKLFDLSEDPGEYQDLAAKRPKLAQRLQDKFDAWDSTLPNSKAWGGPGNRNYDYAKGSRRGVVEHNQNPNKVYPGKVR